MLQEDIIEQINLARDSHKINLDRMEAMHRLFENKDFVLVFKDFYLGSYLKRVVTEELALATADTVKQSAVDKVKAIGLFDQFIRMIDRDGGYAKQFLEASDEELVRAYMEQSE